MTSCKSYNGINIQTTEMTTNGNILLEASDHVSKKRKGKKREEKELTAETSAMGTFKVFRASHFLA